MKNNNKAQLKISFQMIFAIILIIFFIVFAFFGVKKFIDNQELIVGKSFSSQVREEIGNVLSSSESSNLESFNIPKKVEQVCFEQQPSDSGNSNMYSMPRGIIEEKISGINWQTTNPSGETLCIESEVGNKISIVFQKMHRDDSVTIINAKDFVPKELQGREGNYEKSYQNQKLSGLDSDYSYIGDLDLNDFEVIFKQDFENTPIGDYNCEDWAEDWEKPHSIWCDSNNPDRKTYYPIVRNTKIIQGHKDNPSRVLEVIYPKTKTGGTGGNGWTHTFTQGYEELYLTFRVNFKEGFEPKRGGKLHGLLGGDCPMGCQGICNNGFSSRFSFWKNGGFSPYVYFPEQSTQCGENCKHDEEFCIYENFKNKNELFTFNQGEWHELTMRIVINTPSEKDGILETFVDGVLSQQKKEIMFREEGKSYSIERLYFITFFGGGTDCLTENPDEECDAPNSKDEYAYFDDFYVWRYKEDVSGVPEAKELSDPKKVIISPTLKKKYYVISENYVPLNFNDLTYAVIGDSMSADFSSDWIEDFANKADLSEEDFRIYANPGDSCSEVYAQLENVNENTNILFSSCGVNRFSNSNNPEWWEKIYEKAKEKGISKIFMTTMPPWDNLKEDVSGCEKMKSENQWLMDFASDKEDLIVIDLWTMWYDSTGTSTTNCGWHPDKDLSDGYGLHPNSKANQEWGEQYYNQVNEYVNSLSSEASSQTKGNTYRNLKTSSCNYVEILYENNFEHNSLGYYDTLNQFNQDWQAGGSTRWEYSKVVTGIGDNPTKVFQLEYPFYEPEEFSWICWGTTDCEDPNRQGARKVFYTNPTSISDQRQFRNGVGPPSGGGYWEVKIPSRKILYLSYKFRFGEGFYPVDGGKLPGFCGGHCPGGGSSTDKDGDGTSDGFSARLMFEPPKDEYPVSGRFYVYHPDRDGEGEGGYGSSQLFNKGISTGEWHTIVQRVEMNDLNSNNGRLTAWLDGVKVTDQSGYNFRQGNSANFQIDKIMFTTFFGGNGEKKCTEEQIASEDFQCGRYNDGSPYYFYAPRKDEIIHFDDVIVYTYNGGYEDGEAWPPPVGNRLNSGC